MIVLCAIVLTLELKDKFLLGNQIFLRFITVILISLPLVNRSVELPVSHNCGKTKLDCWTDKQHITDQNRLTDETGRRNKPETDD